jgi:hypothetical protein
MIFRNTPELTPARVKSVLTVSVGQQIWEEGGFSRDKRPRDVMVFGLHSLSVCVLGTFSVRLIHFYYG